VLWLLQKEPRDRFRNAADAGAALENLDETLEDESSTDPSEGGGSPPETGAP
jgi:hypothetical protein